MSPSGQGRHVIAPFGSLLNFPTSQEKQSPMSSWAEYKTPLSVLNFPARQTSQDMCLAASVAWSGLYFPAGQMEHLERELWRSGEVALSALKRPAGQTMQEKEAGVSV